MKVNKNLVRYSQFLLGLVLFSVGFNYFLLPNNLVFGGLSGLSIVFDRLWGIDPALFVLIGSLILLVFSYFLLGKEVTARSVVGSLLLPLFMKFIGILSFYYPIGETELLIAALYGGVFTGIGLGLVYKTGFTTGGTDIVNQIVNKYIGFSIGKSIFICDGIIVLSGVFVFGIVKAMYAGIVLFLISKLSDRMILGISNSKSFYIITDHPDEVRKFILKELGHGVTEFSAKGGFKKETQKVLFSVIPTREYYLFKEGLKAIDKDAFFVTLDAYESMGAR